MDYGAWELSVPESITGDALWRLRVYRLALYVADVAWTDATRLAGDPRTRSLSDQLYRALGSTGANIAEGYSRGSGRDRAHFYEYALGSARESRDWYYRARHVLGEEIVQQKLSLLSQIIRLLLTILPTERNRNLREEPAPYSPGDTPEPV